MDRPVLLDTIRFLHSDMKERTLWAGVNEKRFEKVVKNVDLYTDEELTEVYDWLLNVWDNQYKVLVTVYNMVPPQNWENYALLGIEDLQEQILMSRAKRALFDVWKNSYYPSRKIIRKVNRNVQEEKSTEPNKSKECSTGGIV